MISVLTPTRGRPDLMDRMLKSAFVTASNPKEVEFLFYIDIDDPKLKQYKGLPHINGCNAEIVVGDPIRPIQSWNVLAKKAKGDLLMLGNDDLVFGSVGWDVAFHKAAKKYKDDIYCLWANDLINGGNHCAFPVVSRKWVDTLGYFTKELFLAGYVDTWIFEMAKSLNRCHYLKDVIIEHRHFTTGKAPFDETYARTRRTPEGNLWQKDDATFKASRGPREVETEKLRKLLK